MKRTRKFVAAEIVAQKIGVPINNDIYANLQENNYFWNSDDGQWYEGKEPDPPTRLIKLRLWADKELIDNDCNRIINLLINAGFTLVDKSEKYTCRPPKQLEARIYLTFDREI